MRNTCLIMAGGKGERFWPKSTPSLPKQFLDLTNSSKTMIQLTVERIHNLVEYEDIYIATNINYKELCLKQLPMIPEENIICEPIGKNTAPCIGLGCIKILNKYEDALMYVLPSDHSIKDEELYLKTLKEAKEIAMIDNNLVTIGIKPTYPEVGYGYIKYDSNNKYLSGYKVDSFKEKPILEVAKEYLNDGHYLWNAGQFIWKVSSIMNSFKTLMPNLYNGLIEIKEDESKLNEIFNNFESISIDYGVMEKSKDIYILSGTFGWDDVGSWLALERIQKQDEYNNTISGDVNYLKTTNCIIQGNNKKIVTIGLDNLVIVDSEEALLIVNKDNVNEIKEIKKNIK